MNKRTRQLMSYSLISIVCFAVIYIVEVRHWEWYIRMWDAKILINGQEEVDCQAYRTSEKIYIVCGDNLFVSSPYLLHNSGSIVKGSSGQGHFFPRFGVSSRKIGGIRLDGTDPKVDFFDARPQIWDDRVVFQSKPDITVEVSWRSAAR